MRTSKKFKEKKYMQEEANGTQNLMDSETIHHGPIQETHQDQETHQEVQEEEVQEVQEEEVQVREKGKKKAPSRESSFSIEKEFAHLANADEKLKQCIHMMREALSQKGAPSFRLFWDVRKYCMEVFKEEKILPGLRAQAWSDFTELTEEARRLKELLDEQSNFMVDQINLAIDALEKEVHQIDEYVGRSTPPELPDLAAFLPENRSCAFYANLQNKLDVLNRFASQINQMRKELIKTDMRIRKKNQFFERLSKTGDLIFPRRKELIKELSEYFMQDVETFVSHHISGTLQLPFYSLREAIKSFQGMAKILTLNTKAFTHARKNLSDSWDLIRKMDKERKKEWSEKHQLSHQNAARIKEEIEHMDRSYEAGELDIEAVQEAMREIQSQMRHEELSKEDVRLLKEALHTLRVKVNEKLDAERKQRDAVEKEKQQERQRQVDQIIEAIAKTKEEVTHSTPEALQIAIRSYQEQLKALSRRKSEEKELLRYVEPLAELLIEKREQSLLSLSDDQRQNLDNLKQVLLERQQRRAEYKEEFDEARKQATSSGLDFVQAMEARERLNIAREKLSSIEESIAALEEQIEEIRGS